MLQSTEEEDEPKLKGPQSEEEEEEEEVAELNRESFLSFVS